MHTPTINAGPSRVSGHFKLVVSGLKTPLALRPNHNFSHLIKQRMDEASLSLGVYIANVYKGKLS